jgi:hypothetical protein
MSDKVQILTAEQFLRASQAKSNKVASSIPYVDGNTSSWTLPQVGLGHMIWMVVNASIKVEGTITDGTFKGYPDPSPLSIIKRVRFGSNTSLSIRNLSGWNLYKWIRYRTGIDTLSTDGNALFSSDPNTALGVNNTTSNIVPGADVAAKTYNCNFLLPMPISYNEQGETGLIVLQQNSVFYKLDIDWGQIAGGISATGGTNDLFTGLTGTDIKINIIFNDKIRREEIFS